MSCGCFCTCCVFAGHTFSANSGYLGKMPDVNYSEVDFVNCTQDTLPGGRFIQCGTRGVCARLGKRPLGIGLACHKTNKQPTTLALSVITICKERFFIPNAWSIRSLLWWWIQKYRWTPVLFNEIKTDKHGKHNHNRSTWNSKSCTNTAQNWHIFRVNKTKNRWDR